MDRFTALVVVYSPGPWTLDTISAYSHPPVSSPGRGSCGKLGAHWSVVMSTGVSQYSPIYALNILAGVLKISPRQALLIHLAFNMDMQTFCSKSGNLFQCRTPLPKNLHHNHIHKISRGYIYTQLNPFSCRGWRRESRSAGGCVPSWHVTPRGHSVGGDWCSSQMVTLATLGTWSIDPTYSSDTHMRVQE